MAAFCAGFEGGLSGEDAADDGPRVSFMQSDGGLTPVAQTPKIPEAPWQENLSNTWHLTVYF